MELTPEMRDALIIKNKSSISALTTYAPTEFIDNICTLNLSNSLNFALTVNDTNAKTIQFSNPPNGTDILLPVTVLLVYASAAAITHPTGVVWQGGVTPTFAAGNKYILMYSSWDNGTTWRGSVSGAWAS